MKKNLRIVSAAAAALLTVAPVVATTTSTVFADDGQVINGGVDQATTTQATDIALSLKVNNADKLTSSSKAKNVKFTLSTSLGQFNADAASNVKLVDERHHQGTVEGSSENPLSESNVSLISGDTYHLEYQGHLNGLNSNNSYTSSQADGNVIVGNTGTTTSTFTVKSASFTITNSNLKGTPSVLKNEGSTTGVIQNKITSSATSGQTLHDIYVKIFGDNTGADGKYYVKPTGAGANSIIVGNNEDNFVSALKSALEKQGINVDPRTNKLTDVPSAPLTFDYTISANNGKTTTIPVTIDFNDVSTDASVPGFRFTGAGAPGVGSIGAKYVVGTLAADSDYQRAINSEDNHWNYVPVNGTVDKNAIAKSFQAVYSKGKNGYGSGNVPGTGNADTGDSTVLSLDSSNVDTSKVNTKVAGKYNVTLNVTNPAGKKSSLTFKIVVGQFGATYKKVNAGAGQTIPVYTINGNTVTASKDETIADGTEVATFDNTVDKPIVVNGVNYTRINESGSNQYIETKYVDGSYVPAASSTKTVMHASFVYDKDHKRVGTRRIASYTDIQVTGDPVALSDGTMAYQIGDNQYVDAKNIDGTKMTLKHNAYIYSTSKKHSKSSVKKGTTVTVYGGSFTFKDGKKYYRIGKNKQYMKVANF